MLRNLHTIACLKAYDSGNMSVKFRVILMRRSEDIRVWSSSRTSELVMWHSRVPTFKANFGSCDWISTILGLLESPRWDEHNHLKTACIRCFLPELGSFGCCESSEIFKFSISGIVYRKFYITSKMILKSTDPNSN